MNGYEFFQKYQALHLHFTSTYDVFKYCGKSKTINTNSYDKRRDKHLFELWASKFFSTKQVGQYCLAQFVNNDHNWLYQSKQQADEFFLKWKSIRDSQLHYLKNDFNVLSKIVETKKVEHIKDLFRKTPSGNKPPILQLLLARNISKESVIILDHCILPVLDKWGIEYEIDPMVSDTIFLLNKYTPFITPSLDDAKIKELFKEIIKENETI